ncbi:MAG: ABC transporter substrate-binding protein [Desulfovibrio sp.]|nr:ABC transporter substrate-binding protein [Desulfovibrio sp.]MBI4961580.1 ABC transporter substrate-binding protein [Desulfovibrio sp.]
MGRALLFVILVAFVSPAMAEPVGAPIPLGIAVATTSNVALFGEEQVNGAKIAEAYLNARGGVNGTPVKLVFQDTGGDEAGAINAFQTLITAKVTAIIGPTLSQQAFAADPLADRAKVPVIGPSNTAKGIPQIGEYIGRISAPMTVVAPNSLKKALALNPQIKKTAVLFAQNDAFSTSETGVFQEAIKALNLEIVTLQKFQTTDTDFTTHVTAVLGSNADLVVISGLAADSGNLVKQLRQLGYKGLIVGGNGLNSSNMFPVCGSLCEGILVAQAYSPQADIPVNKEFVAKFTEAYKKGPAQFSAQAFAGVQILVEALAKVEKESGKKITEMELADVRTALNKALRTGSYMTPLGEVSLDAEGEVHQKQFYVSVIKMSPDGKAGAFELSK